MKVVVVMTRAPEIAPSAVITVGDAGVQGPKTRLAPVLPDPAARQALQRAFLADTLATARAVPGAIVRVAIAPGGDPASLADLGVPAGQVITQRGDTLGDREQALFADLFRRGARQMVLIGSDIPLLTTDVLVQAFAALDASPSPVVIGPASDGGYYLLGLSGPLVPDLFTGVRWSTKYALMDTLRRCEFAERRTVLLDMLDDVDDPDDLARLREMLREDPSRAPATAAWLQAHR
ncbi:TIGR04282 family arsenosugar biosynthesis glycosyltransferase [Luteitalea sp.]|uniref:TIGR04282 family arsenosugar biosynthesis glycosyltransferase n=1 Tax=Luteitalea sp. TaxID=2004800 RepID=UPI0037C58A4E